jgi:hypothetical protein
MASARKAIVHLGMLMALNNAAPQSGHPRHGVRLEHNLPHQRRISKVAVGGDVGPVRDRREIPRCFRWNTNDG